MAVTLKGQTAVYEGTSTDTKPTDADNNAIFKELDTGISYYYDGTDWNEIPSSGGGGGGTGTDNYNELNNKPSINGTVLSGNKSLDNLGIQKKLTFDSAPTEDSENPVESGGVYSALAGKQDTISDLPTIRSGAAAGATAVQPADVIAALATKQDVLTTEQLAAVNSGITSADVEQITTNKNNILLKANTSDVNTATANLQAQINNIVTPVTQDAEVQNARVGADGTAYTTLKERLDSEQNRSAEKPNLLDLSKLTVGKYMENGVPVDYATWSYSDYIAINSAKGISWGVFHDVYNIGSPGTYFILSYYGSTKDFISEQTKVYYPSQAIVPETAAYVVISARTNVITDSLVMVVNDTMPPVEYKPYMGTEYAMKSERPSTTIIRSISRLGYKSGIPEQSIPAYIEAYNRGFRIMLCDLQFTSDNVPVCYHDATLDRKARNNDGTEITETVTISSTTYANLLNYDLGIYYGETYRGTKILKLEDMIKWAKMAGVELYIEIKYANFPQIMLAAQLVEQFGMIDSTSWSSHYRDTNNQKYQVVWVSQLIPTARVALMTDGDGMTGTAGYMDDLLRLKNGVNEVFAFNWAEETLTDTEVEWLKTNAIAYEQGVLDTAQSVLDYFDDGYNRYCTGVESNAVVASKVLLDAALEGQLI